MHHPSSIVSERLLLFRSMYLGDLLLMEYSEKKQPAMMLGVRPLALVHQALGLLLLEADHKYPWASFRAQPLQLVSAH